MWVPWVKIDGEWWRFQPSHQWIAANDTAITAVRQRNREPSCSRKKSWGVTIVILWDGWGSPADPCGWGRQGSAHEVDIEIANESYMGGPADPWAGMKIE